MTSDEDPILPDTPLGWWVMSGEQLMIFLRRAHDGEDPDMLYAEAYANSDHRDYRTDPPADDEDFLP